MARRLGGIPRALLFLGLFAVASHAEVAAVHSPASSPRTAAPRKRFFRLPESAKRGLGLLHLDQRAFYDLDGTIYDGTAAHTSWWFALGLPNPAQRVSKALQFLIALPAVGIVAAFDEGRASAMLAWIATRGVTKSDAETASKAVAEGIKRRLYTGVMEHLQHQQVLGRKVCVLTGNIAPVVKDFCDNLGCDLIGTNVREGAKGYSGEVEGAVCVDQEKRRRLIDSVKGGKPRSEQELSQIKHGVIGVGNSNYDIPFLEEVGRAFVVRPSRKLRRAAKTNGWALVDHHNRPKARTLPKGKAMCLPKVPSPPAKKPNVVEAGEKFIGARRRRGPLAFLLNSMEASMALFWGGLALLAAGAGGRKSLWDFFEAQRVDLVGRLSKAI